jgi:hypothetical protein
LLLGLQAGATVSKPLIEVQPPSLMKAAPVANEESSLARNSAILAIPAASPSGRAPPCDPGAFLCEQDRRSLAHAASRPGDDRNLVGKLRWIPRKNAAYIGATSMVGRMSNCDTLARRGSEATNTMREAVADAERWAH